MDILVTTNYTSLLKFLLGLYTSEPSALETKFTTIKAEELIQVANDFFSITLREPGRKKGSAPNREPNDRHNAGAADRLYDKGGGRANVPKGARETDSGGGGDDRRDRRDNSGRGGGGAGGGGDGKGNEGGGGRRDRSGRRDDAFHKREIVKNMRDRMSAIDVMSAKLDKMAAVMEEKMDTADPFNLESLKQIAEELSAGRGQDQKKLVQQLDRSIVQFTPTNRRGASEPTFSTNFYAPEARVVRPPNFDLKVELRLYICKSEVRIASRYLGIKGKASARSRMPNESYNGGSLDGLFKGANGGVGVPRGLRDAAGNGDGGDENPASSGGSGGGAGGGGGGDDDGDDGDDEDEEDSIKRAAIAYQDELAKHGPPLTQKILERQQRRIHIGCCEICQGLQASFTSDVEGRKVCDRYRRLENFHQRECTSSEDRSTPLWVPTECKKCDPQRQALNSRERARGVALQELRGTVRGRAVREEEEIWEGSLCRASSMPPHKAIWRTSPPVAPKFNAADWF